MLVVVSLRFDFSDMTAKRQLEVEQVCAKIRDVGSVGNVGVEFEKVSEYYSRRYRTLVKAFIIHLDFSRPDDIHHGIQSIQSAMDTLVDIIKQGVHPDDFVGVTLSNTGFKHDAYVVPRQAKDFTASLMAQR